jgi:hypothetical protein
MCLKFCVSRRVNGLGEETLANLLDEFFFFKPRIFFFFFEEEEDKVLYTHSNNHRDRVICSTRIIFEI